MILHIYNFEESYESFFENGYFIYVKNPQTFSFMLLLIIEY